MRLPLDDPRPWLLLDACGALLSAFTHAVVLQRVTPFTGMPASVLSALAIVAAGFATYSALSWGLATRTLVSVATAGRLLRIVALANAMYALLTIGLVAAYWSDVTALGVGYFAAEVVIIVLLVRWEFRVGLRTAVLA